MRRLSPFIALAAIAILAVPAMAGSPALKSFGTGDVTIESPTSATIVTDAGEYGGVCVGSKNQAGKYVDSVVFMFTSRGDVGGGAPRFSLPIDTDGNLKTNEGTYAFIDAAGCGAATGDNPTNIATLVSTQNPTCHVNFANVDYANWDAFADANPTYRTGKATPFIIADSGFGTFVVSDIVLSY